MDTYLWLILCACCACSGSYSWYRYGCHRTRAANLERLEQASRYGYVMGWNACAEDVLRKCEAAGIKTKITGEDQARTVH